MIYIIYIHNHILISQVRIIQLLCVSGDDRIKKSEFVS
ncbi:hypothetical protein pb186bvf_009304 [Paramecium bursaria]